MDYRGYHTFIILCITALVSPPLGCQRRQQHQLDDVDAPLTYHNQVAEIIHSQCADCHRRDGGAPFPLLTYEDAAQRAGQIADVVASGYMPPWPPDTSVNSFVDERQLSKAQIEKLQAWADLGAPKGAPHGLSQEHVSTRGATWSLGAPDLVVSFERPFEVPAEVTEDIYRNFVIPIPLQESKYVNAVEIRPSNLDVAHHLFVRIDRSGVARSLSGQDGKPGFDYMQRPYGVKAPDGCILSWQVGKQPSPEPDGVAWRLDPDSDFVIECHLQPTGKKELLDIRIGLHFTSTPPTRYPLLANLRQLDIDIPAGEANYHTSMEYTLPVAATATAVLPHAHFLGRRMEGYAVLPTGEKQILIRIPEWNFNWQGEYRYQDPLRLPAGTRIVMDYQFDNSSANPQNPNSPPKRVRYGPRSTDEMSELALQLIPDSREDYVVLARDFGRWQLVNDLIPHELRKISDATLGAEERYRSAVNVAKAYFMLGQQSEALKHLKVAKDSPAVTAEAYFLLGRICVDNQDMSNGKSYFQRGLQLNPKHPDSLNGLGIIANREQRYGEAANYFRRAIQARPKDLTAYQNLGNCLIKARKYDTALKVFEEALRLEPQNRKARQSADQLRRLLSR